jgi:predicted DNA-binding transcriptional regulator AlpA
MNAPRSPDRQRRAVEFFEAPGFFSERDLDVITSTSRTTRWRMRRTGTFPKAVQISPGRRGTPKRLVMDWIEQRQEAELDRNDA